MIIKYNCDLLCLKATMNVIRRGNFFVFLPKNVGTSCLFGLDPVQISMVVYRVSSLPTWSIKENLKNHTH